jgi:hypothetical protein
VSGGRAGEIGNREVPLIAILSLRVDLRDAWAEAYKEEEGGSWGKHGFPHATEPKAKEAA